MARRHVGDGRDDFQVGGSWGHIEQAVVNKWTTDTVRTVTLGGLASGSEFNMSRTVAQGFGLDRPGGKIYAWEMDV